MQPGDACTACAMHEVPDSTPHHTPRPGVCCRLAFAEVLGRSRQLVAILLEGPPRARNVDELLLKESMDVIGARARRPAPIHTCRPGPSPACSQRPAMSCSALLPPGGLPRFLVNKMTISADKKREGKGREHR